jgi:hypothetical protein
MARTTAHRPTTLACLPTQSIHVVDRVTCAWQDVHGTWRGDRENADTCVMAAAPAGFHVSAVLQPEHPYLWIGIAAPDTLKARICYATISGEALRDLAVEILRYVPPPKKDQR